MSDEKCNALRSALESIVSNKGCEEGFSPGIDRTGANPMWEPKYNCVMELLPDLYSRFSRLSGTYKLGSCALLLGELDFQKAGEMIRLKRKEDENRFVAMLAAILGQKGARESEDGEGGNVSKDELESIMLLLKEQQQRRKKGARDEIQLDNEGLELPEELLSLIDEIENDLGTLPEAYVQAASGLAGGGLNKQQNSAFGQVTSFTPVVTHSYDDYKGQYAIEDTRKALLEARGAGVYPFCITIDKSAHEYLAHMFGRGNFVFVDNVPSLPAKLAEMYRLLTS